MRQKVKGVWQSMPNLIDTYHLRHLERQRSKPLAKRPERGPRVKDDDSKDAVDMDSVISVAGSVDD